MQYGNNETFRRDNRPLDQGQVGQSAEQAYCQNNTKQGPKIHVGMGTRDQSAHPQTRPRLNVPCKYARGLLFNAVMVC